MTLEPALLIVSLWWFDSVALVLDLKLCTAGQLICYWIDIGAGLGVDAWCDRKSFPGGLMDVCWGGALVLLCWCLLVWFLRLCAGLGLNQFWGIILDLKSGVCILRSEFGSGVGACCNMKPVDDVWGVVLYKVMMNYKIFSFYSGKFFIFYQLNTSVLNNDFKPFSFDFGFLFAPNKLNTST